MLHRIATDKELDSKKRSGDKLTFLLPNNDAISGMRAAMPKNNATDELMTNQASDDM